MFFKDVEGQVKKPAIVIKFPAMIPRVTEQAELVLIPTGSRIEMAEEVLSGLALPPEELGKESLPINCPIPFERMLNEVGEGGEEIG